MRPDSLQLPGIRGEDSRMGRFCRGPAKPQASSAFFSASREEVRPALGIGIDVGLRPSASEAVQVIWKTLRQGFPEGELSCSRPVLLAALSIYVSLHNARRQPRSQA